MDKKEKILYAALCMTRQCWEQGILTQAAMEIQKEELWELMAEDMTVRQSEDGRLCNIENTPAVTDSSFCIPSVYLLEEKEGKGKYGKAAEKNLDFLLNRAQRSGDGILYHMINTREIWADSAAFLPYSLALAGFYEEAYQQMEGICSRLYREKEGLYFHIWDDGKKQFLRPLFWGVGNGWILTGLLRTLLVWNHQYAKEEKQMKKRFFELLDNMLWLETKEHGFHDILDDKDSFCESETAAMVAYTIYRGIKEGIVKKDYMCRADCIREALYKKIKETGIVMDASGSPDFLGKGTSVECQAHVIMMEQAYDDVRKS